MSTDCYELFTATVHSLRPDGKVNVFIPALGGHGTVTMDPPVSPYEVPDPGVVRFVAVNANRTEFKWISSADLGTDALIEAALAAHEAAVNPHPGYATDADVATLTNNTAWGVIDDADYLSGQVTLAGGGGYTNLTQSITETLSSDRLYRLSFGCRAIGAASGTPPLMVILDMFDAGVAMTGFIDTWIWVAGNYTSVYLESYAFPGDDEEHSYDMRAKMNGAGTAMFHSGGYRLTLTDVGPVTRT